MTVQKNRIEAAIEDAKAAAERFVTNLDAGFNADLAPISNPVNSEALLEESSQLTGEPPETIEQIHSPGEALAANHTENHTTIPSAADFIRDHLQVIVVGGSGTRASKSKGQAAPTPETGPSDTTDMQETLAGVVNLPLPDGTPMPIATLPLADLYAVSALVAEAERDKNKKRPAGAYLTVMVRETYRETGQTVGQDQINLPAPLVYVTATDGQHLHIITPDEKAAEAGATADIRQNAQHLMAACDRGEAPPHVVLTTDAAGVTWHRFSLFMPANTMKGLMSQVKAADMKRMAAEQVKGQRTEMATIGYTHTERAKQQAALPRAERRGGIGMFTLMLADGTIYPLVDAEHFGAYPTSIDQVCRTVVNGTQKACDSYQPFADLTDEKNLLQGRASPLDAHTTPATLSSVLVDIHKHLLKFDKDSVMMQLATAHRVCDVNLWSSTVSVLQRSIVATTRYLPHTIHNVIDRAWSLPGQ